MWKLTLKEHSHLHECCFLSPQTSYLRPSFTPSNSERVRSVRIKTREVPFTDKSSIINTKAGENVVQVISPDMLQ